MSRRAKTRTPADAENTAACWTPSACATWARRRSACETTSRSLNRSFGSFHPTPPRRAARHRPAHEQDGAGVKLTRVLTHDLQQRLDPFLMLDNFASDDPNDYGAGFPSHPHRGFETVSYMLTGNMRHKDSAGHEGLITDGGVQWMTAGRGVIHSEMPEQNDGVMEGFQLWLNLPGKDKMCPPWYRDIQSPEVPEYTTAEAAWHGARDRRPASHGTGRRAARSHPAAVPGHHLPRGRRQLQPAAARGAQRLHLRVPRQVDVAGTAGGTQRMAILANEGDGVTLQASGAARALLIAGQPLREPIAQYGPFRHEHPRRADPGRG
jgi:redox-sensitive bicupin YhaK (pirin superfamily)